MLEFTHLRAQRCEWLNAASPYPVQELSCMTIIDAVPTASITDAERLVGAATELRPTIRSYQAQIEQERRLPTPLVAQLKEAGLYRMLVPQQFGGTQVDLPSFFRALALVAEGDGAVGWNLATSSAIGSAALSLPTDGVAEIFDAGPDICFSGALGPAMSGQAESVPGGYRVTGRWRFGSGCREADWLGGGCRVTERG